MKARRFAMKSFVALATLALICFAASYLYRIVANRKDNMLDLIAGRPHPPLVRLDLELGGPDNKKRIISIKDSISVNYINTKQFGPHKDQADYDCGAFWPFQATFVFADGRNYKAEVTVPNRRGYLEITYPINYWRFDALDDKRHTLDLDVKEVKSIDELFEGLGAYKDEFRPAGKKKM